MSGYLGFLLAYAGPFIAVALLMLAWFYAAWKLEGRYPRFYKFTERAYNNLPQLGAVVIIVVAIYFFFTESSYYEW